MHPASRPPYLRALLELRALPAVLRHVSGGVGALEGGVPAERGAVVHEGVIVLKQETRN